MIDKMVMEMMIKNITEKIIEQEIVYNKMDDMDVQAVIRKRIEKLEQGRDVYIRVLKAYGI